MNKNLLLECTGFEWDKGNLLKNWLTHGVSNLECEQCFFNTPLIVAIDTKHTTIEDRYFALGKSDMRRPLFLVFTIRKLKIRIISARDISKKERTIYREKEYPNKK